MTKEKVFLELTYRYKGYETKTENYPEHRSIYHVVDFAPFSTDANIDASCNRPHYGSNWLVCVGKSILMIYNRLLIMINTRISP